MALHMLSAYCGLPYRTERSAKEFARVLSRPGQVVWICDDDDHGFAYVSVRGNSILEYAGCADALRQLLNYLLRNGSWNVSLPPVEGESPLEALLLEHAQHYSVRPTGMIRVISLKTIFEAYKPLLRDRLQGWDGEIAFRAADNGETLAIVGDSGGVRIECRAADSLAVELDRRELARLLFGPFPPALGDWFRHSAVRRVFPLPLHWHALAHV